MGPITSFQNFDSQHSEPDTPQQGFFNFTRVTVPLNGIVEHFRDYFNLDEPVPMQPAQWTPPIPSEIAIPGILTVLAASYYALKHFQTQEIIPPPPLPVVDPQISEFRITKPIIQVIMFLGIATLALTYSARNTLSPCCFGPRDKSTISEDGSTISGDGVKAKDDDVDSSSESTTTENSSTTSEDDKTGATTSTSGSSTKIQGQSTLKNKNDADLSNTLHSEVDKVDEAESEEGEDLGMADMSKSCTPTPQGTPTKKNRNIEKILLSPNSLSYISEDNGTENYLFTSGTEIEQNLLRGQIKRLTNNY